jgi:hypothetical protein
MTNVILLPTNIAAINLEGLSVNLLRIFDEKLSCIFSIPKNILLEDTNAISIPEKKAERIKQVMMIPISISLIY